MAHSDATPMGADPRRITELLNQTDWIRSLARRLVGDAARADDVAQEALTVALRKAPGEGRALRPWLARVVQNLAAQGYRTDARRGTREREVARAERTEDHAATLAEAEAHQALVAHVMALDERDRDLLLQRYFQGRSPSEIARREGRTPAAISSQLTRAHTALRRRLEAEGGKGKWLASLGPLLAQRPETNATLLAGGAVFAAAGLLATVAAASVALVAAGMWLFRAPTPGPVEVLASGSEERDRAALELPSLDVPQAERAPLPTSVGPAAEAQVATGTVRPTLTDTEGSPVPGASLRFRWADTDMLDLEPGEDGAFPSTELPASTEITAHVLMESGPWPDAIATFELAPGEALSPTWSVYLSTDVHVLAVDESGTALSGMVVALATVRMDGKEFGRRVSRDRFLAHGRTDESGAFVFEDLEPGDYMIGVLNRVPLKFRTKLDSVNDWNAYEKVNASRGRKGAELLERIRIRPNVERMDRSLTHWSSLKIKGKVVYPDGSPADDVLLLATLPDTLGSLRADSNRKGEFSFGSVAPGRYRVFDNSSPEGWCMPTTLEVDAGTMDLRIVLQRAGTMSGKVLHPDPEGSVDGWVWFIADKRHANTGSGSGSGLGDGPSGTYGMGALTPGSYNIFTYTNDAEYYGLRTNVLVGAGETKEAADIRLEPAAQLSIIHAGSDGTVDFYPYVDGTRLLRQRISAGETRRIAMPPGTLELRIQPPGNAPESTATLQLTVGEEASFTYEP